MPQDPGYGPNGERVDPPTTQPVDWKANPPPRALPQYSDNWSPQPIGFTTLPTGDQNDDETWRAIYPHGDDGGAASIPEIFPAAWTHTASLTIQESRISNQSTLVGFPVLLTEANSPSGFLDSATFQADGGDIRFSSDGAGLFPIPCEVVSFNSTPGGVGATCEIWVKVPLVNPNNDTPFFVWRKSGTSQVQPTVSDPLGRNAVWSDYLCVFHGDDLADATGNGNDLTAFGGATVGGAVAQIGKAFSLSRASSQYLSVGSASMLDNVLPLTVQCWARNTDSAYSAIVAKTLPSGDTPWYMYDPGPFVVGEYAFGWFSPGGGFAHSGGGATPQNTWHMLAAGAGGAGATSAFRWLDGQGGSHDRGTDPQNDAAGNLLIGGTEGGGGGFGFYNGQIDEVRVRAEFMHSDWMQADYENQANPGLFVVPGSITDL